MGEKGRGALGSVLGGPWNAKMPANERARPLWAGGWQWTQSGFHYRAVTLENFVVCKSRQPLLMMTGVLSQTSQVYETTAITLRIPLTCRRLCGAVLTTLHSAITGPDHELRHFYGEGRLGAVVLGLFTANPTNYSGRHSGIPAVQLLALDLVATATTNLLTGSA